MDIQNDTLKKRTLNYLRITSTQNLTVARVQVFARLDHYYIRVLAASILEHETCKSLSEGTTTDLC